MSITEVLKETSKLYITRNIRQYKFKFKPYSISILRRLIWIQD